MKTELQESSMFQDLQIFENNDINVAVDSIYQLLEENFGSIGPHFIVCGSVAKVLHGYFENYEPKDTDLLCRSPRFWRFLITNVSKIKEPEIEIEDFRIKLIYNSFLIEIWKERIPYDVIGIYKDKINYCFFYKKFE